MAEHNRLHLGTAVSPDGNDAWEDVVDMERYIPDDHNYFILFLSADLGKIADMLEKAVSDENRDLAAKAGKALSETHRYFEHPERAYAYINRSLADNIWADKSIREGQMRTKFQELAIFSPYMERDFDYWLCAENGKGTIRDLVRLQNDLKILAVAVLDDSNGLAAYPRPVRNGLYGLVRGDASFCPRISLVPGHVVLPYPESMKGLWASMEFDDRFGQDVFSCVEKLVNGAQELPPSIKKVLDGIPASGCIESWMEYETPCLEDILNLEASCMVSDGTRLKKCKDCGRYFVVTKDNDRFCTLPDKDGTSCLGRHRLEEAVKGSHAIYTQAYRTRYARVKRGKESKEDLDLWRKQAKKLREDLLKGMMTLDEYKKEIMEI